MTCQERAAHPSRDQWGVQSGSALLANSRMQIEVIDRRSVSEADAAAIAQLLCSVWQVPGKTVESRGDAMLAGWRDYHGPEQQFPRSFVIRLADRAIAHAEIVPRTIGTDAGALTIGALAGVCTHPDFRGKGLGRRIVSAAFRLIDERIYPFSLFQNYGDRRTFYEQFGARTIDNLIVNSFATESQTNPFWADLAMIYPASRPWPSGTIDLRGAGY
jgi:GNAT superfamily N-acetyltransferase